MRSFAKLRRDTKALSPIFAVLLLIAIAVIAGIVVYMFTSGYIATMVGGGTAGQEKVAIEAVEVDSLGGLNVYAISTGGGPVDIVGYIVRDQTGNTVSQGPLTVQLLPGALSNAIACGSAPTTSGVYTVSLVSSAGGQFVSQSFKV